MATDQEIRDAGFKFIPKQEYLLSPFEIPSAPEAPGIPDNVNTGGIVNTNAFNNNDRGTFYTGSTSDLVSGFQTAVDDRQKRLEELNRPLAEAQFPSFRESYGMATLPDGRVISNIENAQNLYNQASGYIQKGMDPNTIAASNFSYRGVTDPTIGQIKDMAAEQVQDFQEKYRTGQLGPSYIPAEKPTLSRRINDAIYSLPFLNKPQSAQQIIKEGYTPGANLGILSNILGKADKFGTLPRADQAFITSQMGYTGPTVFGENTSGLSKDPFGINTRSAFGNYAEFVEDEVEKMEKIVADQIKRGLTNTLQMKKLDFYRQKKKERDAFREQDAQGIQDEIETAAAAKDRDAALAAIKRQGEASYTPSIHGGTDYGRDSEGKQSFSGESIGAGDLGFGIGSDGGPVSNRTGRGRTGFFYGGLASIL